MLKLFPWENENTKPYWVNPDNGLEWWFDKSSTEYCHETPRGLPSVNAVCFYIVKNDGFKYNPLTRIAIDPNTRDVLAEDPNMETFASKIDTIRLVKHFGD